MSEDQRAPAPARPGAPGREREAGGLVIGRPFGVPVVVSPTWLLIAALITWWFAPLVEQRAPGLGPWRYAVSLAFAVLLYLSVLVHELSHTVVALRFGIPVRRVSLHLLGGVSEIEREPPSPGRELLIAAAGPAVSLVLGGLGMWATVVLPASGPVRFLALELAGANLLVGVFNLLPGLPLDGGRMLQAAVWRVTGRRTTGLVVAGWAGRVVALLVVAVPLLLTLAAPGHTDLTWTFFTVLVGLFIWQGGSQAVAVGRLRERLPALHAERLARRAFPVAADLPLAEALRRAAEAGARALVVVDHEHRPVALVNEAAVQATPEQRRPWVSVGTVARALEPGLVLPLHLQGEALVDAMQGTPATEYLLVDGEGRVYGVLARADVDTAFARS